MTDLIHELNNEIADVVESAHRTLVQVHNGRRGKGAGTIWHPEGLILTNAHVVHGRGSLQVTLPDGRTLPAKVLAQDPDRDLAALRVDATDLPAIELGDSRVLRPGQLVWALGHPWGVTDAVTMGVVVGTGAQLQGMPQLGREWIAVNLHLRPGHSGGPLVDARGRLVGINTIMTGPSVGLAIPVHMVVEFLREKLGSGREVVHAHAA